MRPTQRTLQRALDAVVAQDLGLSPYRLRTEPYEALRRAGRVLRIHVPQDWTEQSMLMFVHRMEGLD